MIVESLAIIAIVVMVIFGFLRSKKFEYVLGTVPLVIVPIANLLVNLFASKIGRIINVNPNSIIIWVDIIALAVSSGVTAHLATTINNVKIRRSFIIVLCLYSVILTGIFVHNAIEVMF